MKKIFLGLTVLASSLSFAQQFGVKAGLNLSDISNTSTAVDTKIKTGFYAGVTATFPITESYSIKPELVYNQMGAKTDLYDFGGIIGQVSTTTKLDYLSLPIMLQYNLPSNLSQITQLKFFEISLWGNPKFRRTIFCVFW